MPLWGTSTSNENKPLWLTQEEQENCYATAEGWVLKHPGRGTEELLVAVRGLDTGLAAPSITKIVFGSGSYVVGTSATVKVSYNEKVTVTGTPTLVVTGSVAGAITASYSSINATGTTLTFTFTVPDAGNDLTIGAQSVVITGATIKEAKAPGTTNADVAITSDVGTAAGTKTSVAI